METSTEYAQPEKQKQLEKIETDEKARAAVEAEEARRQEVHDAAREAREATKASLKASQVSVQASTVAIIAAVASCTVM